MKCNKYKLENTEIEFLGYVNDNEELSFNPFWKIEQLEEDVDPGKPEYCNLQIIHIPESWKVGKRTRDKRLEDEGINSYIDLANAFFLHRAKSLQKPKAIRDLIVEKYIEVLQFVNLEDNGCTGNERTDSVSEDNK